MDASTKFPLGSAFSVTVFYNPVNGIIQKYDLKVGLDFDLRGTKGGGSIWLSTTTQPTAASITRSSTRISWKQRYTRLHRLG